MPTDELAQLLRGQGAHVDPLACIDDLAGQTAVKKVEGFPHSIFAIVFHINYWMDYELRRIAGERPAYPEHASASWPTEFDPASWPLLVNRCRELLTQFAELATSSAEAMQAKIDPTYAGHERLAGSLSAVLWQIVAHNSYHVGQIVLLRQALGVWPPLRGGDTW